MFCKIIAGTITKEEIMSFVKNYGYFSSIFRGTFKEDVARYRAVVFGIKGSEFPQGVKFLLDDMASRPEHYYAMASLASSPNKK